MMAFLLSYITNHNQHLVKNFNSNIAKESEALWLNTEKIIDYRKISTWSALETKTENQEIWHKEVWNSVQAS